MSNPGYPYPQQGMSHSYSAYPPNPSSASYPSQNGVFAPSLGFNVGSPMYMPQPYSGAGYPSSTTGASFAPPYSNYPQPPTNSGYPPNPYPNYPQRSANSGYPQNQAPTHTAYPNQSYQNNYQASSNSRPSYPNSTAGYPNLATLNPGSQGQNYHQSSHYGNQGYGGSGYKPLHTAPILKKSPTVIPASPFNPREDAEVLRKAMKGFGTDEKAIIAVLTRRSNAQRLEITVQFKTLYGKDLIKELKSELSGNFKHAVVALMTPLPQLYAKELHDAISGLGTDETVLIEVLCALTNAEIRTIREAYQKEYHRNLESELKGDTSGHFRRLMVSLCSAGRDESMMTNPEAAAADAQALYNAGENIWGTDESTFNMILCQRNHEQLKLVFQAYSRLTGHDIENAIKSEFSGDIENGLLAVIRSIKNQQAFFAKCLYKSMKGLGTNDRDLIRLVVTRCEIDMADIKSEYIINHKESLGDAIRGDTSGDYRKCLLALIGEA